MEGSKNRFLSIHTLINSGVAQWIRGGIILNEDLALFRNETGATLELLNDDFATMTHSRRNPAGFVNDGRVVKRSQAVTRFTEIPVRNTGTIEVQIGELEMFDAAFSGNGTITVRSNATLTFTGTGNFGVPTAGIEGAVLIEEGAALTLKAGRATTLPGSQIAGDGEVLFQAVGIFGSAPSELDISGEYDVQNTWLEARSKARFHSFARTDDLVLKDRQTELGGRGVIETTGRFLWTGGTMAGGGTTRIRGTLEISGEEEMVLQNRTLEIYGEAICSSGRPVTASFNRRIRINVMPGGTWRHMDDFEINGPPSNQDWLFRN